MAMAREAWPNALNAQLFKSKVGFISLGVYFLSKMKVSFFRGFFPQPETIHFKLYFLVHWYVIFFFKKIKFNQLQKLFF